MRIRLRVPKDESPAASPKPAGLRHWLQSLFSPSSRTLPPPEPRPAPPVCDKRWDAHGEARFFFAGRRVRLTGGDWESLYLFDVLPPGAARPHPVRIVLAESLADAWQQRSGRRLTEAERRALARRTLLTLIDLGQLPEAIPIPPDAVAALPA